MLNITFINIIKTIYILLILWYPQRIEIRNENKIKKLIIKNFANKTESQNPIMRLDRENMKMCNCAY